MNNQSSGGLPPQLPIPSCPNCGNAMVRRTATRGANQGGMFWGCPKFPKCRGQISDTPTNSSGNAAVNHSMLPATQENPVPIDAKKQGWKAKLGSAVGGMVAGVNSMHRWYLESSEPDAKGHWDKDHHRKVLKYIYNRDSGRCGLCAGDMKNTKGAQIEHIVPKIFAVFDIQTQGKVVEGTQYKSLLHKLDNLQAAHSYCNKRKGNTPEMGKWRHPSMPSLGIAVKIGEDKMLALPSQLLQDTR